LPLTVPSIWYHQEVLGQASPFRTAPSLVRDLFAGSAGCADVFRRSFLTGHCLVRQIGIPPPEQEARTKSGHPGAAKQGRSVSFGARIEIGPARDIEPRPAAGADHIGVRNRFPFSLPATVVERKRMLRHQNTGTFVGRDVPRHWCAVAIPGRLSIQFPSSCAGETPIAGRRCRRSNRGPALVRFAMEFPHRCPSTATWADTVAAVNQAADSASRPGVQRVSRSGVALSPPGRPTYQHARGPDSCTFARLGRVVGFVVGVVGLSCRAPRSPAGRAFALNFGRLSPFSHVNAVPVFGPVTLSALGTLRHAAANRRSVRAGPGSRSRARSFFCS